MPENYYEDAEAPEMENKEGSSGDNQTAVLPKSILGGKEFKPGDEVVLRIVNTQEDSVVVEYASESGSYDESEPAPEPAAAPGGMSSLME